MEAKLLGRFRSELFGLSIIGIMIFHFCEDFDNAAIRGTLAHNTPVWLYRNVIGSIGVEVFLLLSGMGIYFSWKNSRSLASFYQKRLRRILTVYVPMGLVFWIIKDIVINKQGAFVFLKDFTLVSFITDGNKNVWYVALILFLYAVFPVIYRLLFKREKLSAAGFSAAVGIAVLGELAMNLFLPVIDANISIAVTRIPIFIVGCAAGYFVENRKSFSKLQTVLIVAVGAVAKTGEFVFTYPTIIWRYASALWSISLTVSACLLLSALDCEKLNSMLRFVGSLSFELYLSHVMIRGLFNLRGYYTYYLKNYMMVIILAIIATAVYRGARYCINRAKGHFVAE